MGAGAISVAFVTPSDLPVVGALCSRCASLSPNHLVCSVGFHLFFNFFLSLSLFCFSPDAVDRVVGCWGRAHCGRGVPAMGEVTGSALAIS